ncbi:MAG: hypothetical protein IJ685_14035 [Selenomonadaceae bacterium]|nr:hypothetical protein [Selenomonadaceae bacterium]
MRKLVGVLRKNFGQFCPQIFFVAAMFAFGIFGTAEAAKQLPEIVWAHDVYTMNVAGDDQTAQRRRGYQLLNAGTAEEQRENREKIAAAIDAKLKEQGAKLPFKLKTSFEGNDVSELNSELSDATVGDAPIALVPIVVIDYAIEQVYQINGTPHYKYIIISALDIAFCSEDDDGALTILGNIPVHYYESIPLSNNFAQMTQRDKAELAQIYTNFTVSMIKKNLDFTKYKKVLKTLTDKKLAGETYRVENISYTSEKAKGILGMNRLMQRICGNIFTSDFAAHTGNVVYPMILQGDTSNWTIDATQGFYVAKMSTSHSGEKTVRMPASVDHKIYLNVSGIGSAEVQTKQVSNINGFKAYRLWMESTIDGKKIEVTNDITEEYLKDTSSANKIIKDEREIFGGLMIGAAVKSAAAQAGKKVK